MIQRTRPAICMGPMGNIQGSFKFMSVNTGKKIIRRNYTRLPMSESIIRKVEKLAEKAKNENGLHFRNRQKALLDWENEEQDENQKEKWHPTQIKQPNLQGQIQKNEKNCRNFDADSMKMKNQQNLKETVPWCPV